MAPLVAVRDLVKRYGAVRAVEGVSFDIERGETLALVGESGCGKTTTGRATLRLVEPTSGTVSFDGTDVLGLGRADLRRMRRRAQIIFQDPYSSLNPRMTVGAIVREGLTIHHLPGGNVRVGELLTEVGLRPDVANRYPHEFSGGQRQRIGIARALAVNPDFIVCDEPVAMLDVSVQAQVINLLMDLQQHRGLTYLFIAHDLSVVAHVATRVAVMYLGRIVEEAPATALYGDPIMPYTRALLSAVPVPEPSRARQRVVLPGEPPSAAAPPPGCAFHPRCLHPLKDAECTRVIPPLEEKAPGHWAACLKEPKRS
ncbi:MAG TPA: ABC transporter ATP-binding protein [Gemmatimonadaceae bacterium]|nr:ABC transporter ATP-binding protein [Gemmatimonadaceae bacterium]